MVKSGKFKTKPTYTGNILTAMGCAVPVAKIPGVQEVEIPDKWIKYLDFRSNETTTIKGKKAIRIVKTLLKRGLFPLLPISVKEISDKQMQISGTDIRIDLQAQVNIQVKCDYTGGVGHLLCTGNLYLQTQECNPYGYT